MKVLAYFLGLTRPVTQTCWEEVRAARVAEVRQLLAEIAEPPCSSGR